MKALVAGVCLLATLMYGKPLLAENPAKVQIAASNQKNVEKEKKRRSENPTTGKPEKPAAKKLDCSAANDARTIDCQNLRITKAIADANARVADWTVVLAVVGFLQFAGLFVTLLATIKAANAAKKSADVAADSAALSERALKLTERAYLEVTEIRPPTRLKIDEVPRIVVWLLNRGRTPATIVGGLSRFQICDEIPDTPLYADSELANSILIGPGSPGSQDVTTEQVVTVDLMRDVHDGRKYFVVWGRVSYRDIFGERHETRFGASMHFVELERKSGSYTCVFKFLTIAGYNSAD